MSNILITGANRGLGLELTRQCLERGDTVVAGCRRPEQAVELQELTAAYGERLHIIQLDVTQEAEVEEAATAVSANIDALDMVINNAGSYPRGERVDGFDGAQMQHVFDVNVTGAMRVTAAFVPLLRRRARGQIINISSQLGSLASMAHNQGDYSYNSSKAALNMVSRKLAHDLRGDGITVIAMHPGWVQTDMGGAHAAITPPESARGILTVAERLTPADSGEFFVYSGEKHPW